MRKVKRLDLIGIKTKKEFFSRKFPHGILMRGAKVTAKGTYITPRSSFGFGELHAPKTLLERVRQVCVCVRASER
jgi:hypothetical protein